MTNEQKGIEIVEWDGYIEYSNILSLWKKETRYYTLSHITSLYLTDLNYLVPVAVKVRSSINIYDANKELADIFTTICYQMATYTKSPEGTYQALFDAVYEGIIYLKKFITMTNEQKAVIIATRDGWQFDKQDGFWYHDDHLSVDVYLLTDRYLTDLNYLVPVVVKVRDEIAKVVDPFNNEDNGLDIFGKLDTEYRVITKTPEGTYQPLFDAVYEAIVYLENQNA